VAGEIPAAGSKGLTSPPTECHVLTVHAGRRTSRIVTNVCLDQLRRRQARPEDQAPEPNSGNHEEGITDFFERQREHRPTLDPERQLFGKEIQARIASAMERLSPRERVVFELKHYQGLKLRAIGDALGTTEETVKNSLFRATRKLRSHLGGLR